MNLKVNCKRLNNSYSKGCTQVAAFDISPVPGNVNVTCNFS